MNAIRPRRGNKIFCVLFVAFVTLTGFGAPQASADSPWWQLLTGSRPTNLQVAPDQSEVQEVKTSTTNIDFIGKRLLIAPILLSGKAIGCLGSGEFIGLGEGFFASPGTVCEEQTGFAAAETVETPADLAALLEGVYGTEVQLAGPEGGGAPPAAFGEGPFTVITPAHWGPAFEFAPAVDVPNPLEESQTFTFGGAASSQVTSEGSGRFTITLTNLGNEPLDATSVPLEIADTLPKGAFAYGVVAEAGGQGSAGPIACLLPSAIQLSCSFAGVLPPYEAIELEILVAIAEGAEPGAGEVSVSGANAVSAAQRLNLSDSPVPFGLEHFSMRAEVEGGGAEPTAEGGEEVTDAGVHPFQLTTTIVSNSGAQSGSGRIAAHVEQPALPRNIRFTLPAGLVGNATAVQPCSLATFLTRDINESLVNDCPPDSAIGVSSVTIIEGGVLGLVRLAVPVFNLPPQRGEPARFGLMVAGVPVVIDSSVNPEDHYRISAEVRNIPQTVQFLAATTTLWGTPGSPAHDPSRGWNCTYFGSALPGDCPEDPGEPQVPFFRMPVSCASGLRFEAAFEPWNTPLGVEAKHATDESAPLGACNREPFAPTISNAPTSRLASNPSGLDFRIDMPNYGLDNPKEGAISEAQFKKVEVTFPEGLTINPSQAEGLATCSEADYARERYDSAPGEGCPQASKIGSVQIATPLLEEEASGALYVATPYENATHSLIGLYLIARVPARGILVKQAIEVRPDPQSGRLVGISDHVPQLPFSSFKLHFREGGRSPLITPPGCGSFQTTAKFTPWSAQNPDDPDPSEVVERSAAFTIDHGVDGGACLSSPAPFRPGFEAGTLNNQAGSYSPFVMRLTRGDGEQDMTKFSSILPPGVVGKIAGVAKCPESGIAQAVSRTGAHGGQEELDQPSCPAASQIGRTVAGAGVGNQLTYVGGKLYLAGPYHGDPLSVLSITPAVAGPFDAGTVVVRIALTLNPVTGEVEADGSASDPIPHILKGIPLNVRDLRVHVDRSQFTLNATSCEEEQARAQLFGGGTLLVPMPDTPVDLSSRYQAAGCASLGFKPKLAINLKGGTKRGSHPALKAIATPRPGDANFAGAVVTLPHSAFLDQAHIRTICTRVQFAAGAGNGSQCPAGAQYGFAKAWTPLLDQPLEGPVFLRSSNHNLPDLVVVLHGLVDIDLAARIDSVHGGIRSSFSDVPDAPVSRFVLAMQGGRKGLIVNSTDLCAGKHRADANLTSQNGRLDRIRPVVRAVGCRKAHRKHRGRGRRLVRLTNLSTGPKPKEH